MRGKTLGAAAIAIAALLSMQSSRAQVQPVPGPGTGIVTVTGKVDIDTMPDVAAIQRGNWTVAVSAMPPVVAAPLPFLRVGGRYEIVWTGGEKDSVRVAQLGTGGWARVETSQRPRWINLTNARYVEELP
jgi:hypothetical protein